MGFFNRLMVAIQAGITAYKQEALVPNVEYGWNTYEARLYRYYLGDLYYSNAVYKSLASNSAGAQRKIDNKLYKRIRGIYNPVFRLVDSYVSKVYGGELDLDLLQRGALPIENADDSTRDNLRNLLIWSNWRANKALFVRHGAKLGDVFLKVVDDTELGRPRIEILHPGKVKDVEKDGNGRIQRAIIEYVREVEDAEYRPNEPARAKSTYIYTEIITPESFATFKDGAPFAYEMDSEGNGLAEWVNPYGFVPLAHVQHRDEGLEWGAAAFSNTLDKIDELNDQASLLNDAVRQAVDIPWLFIGINKPDNRTTFISDEKDDRKVMYVPQAQPGTVDVKALTSQLNIADTILNIEHLMAEIERDMPELSMHRLREATNQTAPGIRASFNDAIDKFQEAQGNYDAGFAEACQMAQAIGGIRKYEGFKGYSAETYLNGVFDWYIKPRAIIDDELSKAEKITALIGSKAPSRWVWNELGVPETEIAKAEQEAEARRQEMMLSFDTGNNEPDGNDNADFE